MTRSSSISRMKRWLHSFVKASKRGRSNPCTAPRTLYAEPHSGIPKPLIRATGNEIRSSVYKHIMAWVLALFQAGSSLEKRGSVRVASVLLTILFTPPLSWFGDTVQGIGVSWFALSTLKDLQLINLTIKSNNWSLSASHHKRNDYNVKFISNHKWFFMHLCITLKSVNS